MTRTESWQPLPVNDRPCCDQLGAPAAAGGARAAHAPPGPSQPLPRLPCAEPPRSPSSEQPAARKSDTSVRHVSCGARHSRGAGRVTGELRTWWEGRLLAHALRPTFSRVPRRLTDFTEQCRSWLKGGTAAAAAPASAPLPQLAGPGAARPGAPGCAAPPPAPAAATQGWRLSSSHVMRCAGSTTSRRRTTSRASVLTRGGSGE
jgi:hypothetical protein